MLLNVQPFSDYTFFDTSYPIGQSECFVVALSFCGLFYFLILASVKNINVV
jgi:hypothetical protein